MSSENPYKPPLTTDVTPPIAVNYRRPNRHVIGLILSASIAYLCFTVMLLRQSSDDDVKGGLLFSLNIPVVGAWCVLLWRGLPKYELGFLASLIQVFITIAMLLWLEHGDPEIIVGTNGTIAAIFAGLNFWLRRSDRPAEMR